MRFFEVVISGAALIAAAYALELNDVPTQVEAGKSYTITYSPKDNTPTTLKLRKGDPNNLDDVAVLTTSATNGEFQWSVDAALANDDDYALEISQEGVEPNFSGQISLSGGSDDDDNVSSSASASATPSTSASDSSETVESTTLITTATSASASVSSTPGANSTISVPSLSRTATGTQQPTGTGSPSGSGAPPESTGAAAILSSSPLALIFGAVAAMAYLN